MDGRRGLGGLGSGTTETYSGPQVTQEGACGIALSAIQANPSAQNGVPNQLFFTHRNWSFAVTHQGPWPTWACTAHFEYQGNAPIRCAGQSPCPWVPSSVVVTTSWPPNPVGCKVYVSAPPPPLAQCGSTCNGVGHPINPISGAVCDTIVDVPTTVRHEGAEEDRCKCIDSFKAAVLHKR